jgi:Icc-related predicted phosphoesterase
MFRRSARKQDRDRDLRIFFAADIHGSDVCFKKFINAGRFYEADVLILGGDITGKAMVPIERRSGGMFRVRFMGAERVVDGEELKNLEKSIRFNGFYPYICDPEEMEQLQSGAASVGHAFTSVMREQAEAWMELADERLSGADIRCFIMPGNDDEPFVDDVIAASSCVDNHDGRVIEVSDYLVAGYGWSNPTPWRTPRERSEQEMEKDLVCLLSKIPDGAHLIFDPHVPPYDSGLDSAPQLRPDFSIVTTGGQPNMVPVGSVAVRHVVENFQPMLVLSGHIHESRGVTRIGSSVAINPGSEYNIGRLLGALVDLDKGAVRRQQLVVG